MFATTGELLLGVGTGVVLTFCFMALLLILLHLAGRLVFNPASIIVMAVAFMLLVVTCTRLTGTVIEYSRGDRLLSQLNGISNGLIDMIVGDGDLRSLADRYLPGGSASLDSLATIAKNPVKRIRDIMLSRIWWSLLWSVVTVAAAFFAIRLCGGAPSRSPGRRSRPYPAPGRAHVHGRSGPSYPRRHRYH